MAMTERVERVKGCMGCPFDHEISGFCICWLMRPEDYSTENHDRTGEPDWCPLRKGPVRVELEEADD